FFYCSLAHRYLHSFPTRRSSDLSALEILGPEFRFKTRFYINGTVSDEGILNGDLIIRGGGDPTFGSETNSGRCPDCLVNEIIDIDRKSTRLNSSHVKISYAVFCL